MGSEKPLNFQKVFVIGRNYSIESMFAKEGATIVRNIKDSTICVWTGGADVSPKLYREKQHPLTYIDEARDRWEQACFKMADKSNKFKVGICRGGQFLNVMNGGSLWQDVDKHAVRGTHPCLYRGLNGVKTVEVTSTHHQMMIPNTRAGSQVWGFAGLSTQKTSGQLRDGRDGKEWFTIHPEPGHSTDTEIVWYPQTKSLCFQPHPEYNSDSTRELFFECLYRAMAA